MKPAHTKTRLLALSGLFAAVIFAVTAYIHIPTGLGYTHAGDGIIYLAASLLPAPYAAAASAVGELWQTDLPDLQYGCRQLL